MQQREKKLLWEVLAIAAILLVLGIVGNMDYADELREAQAYCNNVADGIWPDYKGIYQKECKK